MPTLQQLLDAAPDPFAKTDSATATLDAPPDSPPTSTADSDSDLNELLRQAPNAFDLPLAPEREEPTVTGEFVRGAVEPFKALAKSPKLLHQDNDDELYTEIVKEHARQRSMGPGNWKTKAGGLVGGVVGGVAEFTAATAAASPTGVAAPFVGPAMAFGASGSWESAMNAGVRALAEGKPKSEVIRIAKEMAGVGAATGAGTALALGATGLIPRTASALARTMGTGAIGVAAGGGGQLIENVAMAQEGLEVSPTEGLLEQATIMGLLPVVAHARDLYKQARGVSATDPVKAKALEKEATDTLTAAIKAKEGTTLEKPGIEKAPSTPKVEPVSTQADLDKTAANAAPPVPQAEEIANSQAPIAEKEPETPPAESGVSTPGETPKAPPSGSGEAAGATGEGESKVPESIVDSQKAEVSSKPDRFPKLIPQQTKRGMEWGVQTSTDYAAWFSTKEGAERWMERHIASKPTYEATPPITLGVWPEAEWSYAHLKGLTLGQRADRARFLGLHTKEGNVEVSAKRIADYAQKRLAELEAERSRKPTGASADPVTTPITEEAKNPLGTTEKGQIPRADQLLGATPEQFADWKKRIEYGQDDPARLASHMTDAEMEQFKGQRDELRAQAADILKGAKPEDDATISRANVISLKAQILNEIIEAYPKLELADIKVGGRQAGLWISNHLPEYDLDVDSFLLTRSGKLLKAQLPPEGSKVTLSPTNYQQTKEGKIVPYALELRVGNKGLVNTLVGSAKPDEIHHAVLKLMQFATDQRWEVGLSDRTDGEEAEARGEKSGSTLPKEVEEAVIDFYKQQEPKPPEVKEPAEYEKGKTTASTQATLLEAEKQRAPELQRLRRLVDELQAKYDGDEGMNDADIERLTKLKARLAEVEKDAYGQAAGLDSKGRTPERQKLLDDMAKATREATSQQGAMAKPPAPAPENEVTPSEQKKGFDARQAKQQKKFLLGEIDKAIEEAPETVRGAWQNPELQKEHSRLIQAKTDNPTNADQALVNVEDLILKYKIPTQSPESASYKTLDGKTAQDRTSKTYDAYKRLELLSNAIENANRAMLPRITIEVPGDGVFEIVNDKQALTEFREKAERFPTTAPRAKTASTPRATPSNAAPLGKLEPDAIRKAVAASVSEDATRPVLHNLYSDGKVTVSTDGRRLTIIKGAIGGTEQVPIIETPSGKQIEQGKDQPPSKPITTWKVSYTDLETRAAKRPFYKLTENVAARTREEAIERLKSHFPEPRYGEFRASKAEGAQANQMFGTPEEEPNLKYPNWKQVIPAEADLKNSIKDLDAARLFTVVKQAMEVTSEKSLSIKLWRNQDGSIGVSASTPEIGEYAHNVQEKAQVIVAIAPQYVVDALNAARLVGDEKITLKWIDETSPVVLESKGTKSVIMPMRLNAVPTGGGHTIEGARAEAEQAFGKLNERVSFVHEPDNPSAAYTDRNRIVVNAAQVAPGTVKQVLLEEGLHGVWHEPSVQEAWSAFRRGVTEYDLAAERAKRKGLDTSRETLKEEAAISKLLSNPDAPLAKRVWDAIIAALDKLFGVKVGDDRATLIEAATKFLREESLPADQEARFAAPTTGGAPIEQYTAALRGIKGEKAPLSERFKEAFDVGSRLSTAKDAFGKALSGLKATGDWLKERFQGVENIDELKREKGLLSQSTETRGWQTKQFVKAARRAVPRPSQQAAISKWVDTGGDLAKLQQGEAETPNKFKQAYRDAQKLSAELLTVAQEARRYFAAKLDEAIEAGVLEDGVVDYIHRMYERRPDLAKRAIAYVQSGILKANPALAKERVFALDYEAEKAGFEPVQSFIERIAEYETSLSKAIASRRLIAKATEMRGSDGRPVIDIKGVGIPISDEQGQRTGTLIKPQFNPSKANQPGTKNYRGDYVNREYPALSRWKWVSQDADGKPIFVQGDVAIHPEFVHRFDALLEPSRVRYGKYGRVGSLALATSSMFKQTMLDLSGFHMVQIAVHAMEHRVNPFNLVRDINFESRDIQGLLKGGLTIGGDYRYQGEGLIGRSLIRQIPVLGPLAESYHSWLFQDFIPRIKVTMAEHALERNRERYKGQMTDEQILFKTAQQANDAFGGQNWIMLERSRTAKDIASLIMLAPDFLESRGRFAASGLALGGKRFGNEQRTALLLGALTLYATARILNKLTEDQWHNEPENIFSWVHKGQAYSLRTVQGDILHLLEKPLNFWMHRLNPVFGRTTLEAATGRDEFGRKRTLVEQLSDFVSTAIPISLRTSRERTLFESFANAMGVTDRRWQDTDDAFKLARKWKAAHGVGERGEFIYDPEKDPLRGLKVSLSKQDDAGASREIQKLIQSKTYTLQKLDQYFARYAAMPFTGSHANDRKWEAELSEDEKKTVEAAKAHKKAILKLYRNAKGQYLQATQ